MKLEEKITNVLFVALLLVTMACSPKQESSRADVPQKAGNELSNDRTMPMADLGDGYYRNPVIIGSGGDNTIVRVGEDYYMEAGGNEIWHSRDMVNWKSISTINTFTDGTWASEITYHDGKYYFYTTEVDMSRGNTGPLNMAQRSLVGAPSRLTGDKAWKNVVVWADNPEGPWSDPIDLEVYGYFDPGHIVDMDGNRYLFFNKGVMIKLAPDGLSVEGDIQKVYDGWDIPSDWVMECHCLEAPKLIHVNDYYYMASAQGGTGGPATAHMGVIARAKSLEGPWENSPYNPVVRTYDQNEPWVRQGHGTIIDDVEGNWWFVYTGYENGHEDLGKQCLLLPLEWTEDGWPVVPEGISPADELKKPAGENTGHGFAVSDDFTSDKLGEQWSTANNIDPKEAYAFGEGFLKMPATGEIPEESAVQPVGATLLSVTQFHHAYEVQVEIEIPETAEGGILVSSRSRRGAATSARNAFATAGIRKGEIFATWGGVANYLDYGNSRVFVKIMNMNGDVSCFYSTDGKNWSMFENSTSVTNGYTISLYAAGEGDVIFKNFKFRGLN
ncbi:MAG TPA: family 43 glycosylhydrolase [Draconibacterium sp.]|nr:family 43 glycosylhydrolase [Draconibacterium sp.]